MAESSESLVFVYNARSGIGYKAIDFLHKAISPATYQCRLCAITYGTFTVKKDWQKFIEELSIPAAFLYKEDIEAQYPHYQLGFPAILLQSTEGLALLVGAKEMESLDLDRLKKLLQTRLRQHGIVAGKGTA